MRMVILYYVITTSQCIPVNTKETLPRILSMLSFLWFKLFPSYCACTPRFKIWKTFATVTAKYQTFKQSEFEWYGKYMCMYQNRQIIDWHLTSTLKLDAAYIKGLLSSLYMYIKYIWTFTFLNSDIYIYMYFILTKSGSSQSIF